MELNQATLQEKAIHLFDQMQRIVEDRTTPIIEAYHNDFYDIDRKFLELAFAANSTYLFLLHPNGTYLGRIGVVPIHRDTMYASLKVYEKAHPMERMELFSIDVDVQGNSVVEKIDFKEGYHLIDSKRSYQFTNNVLSSRGAEIASIDATMIRGATGLPIGEVRITTIGDTLLTREQAIAAELYGSALIADQSGLFTPVKLRQINGINTDQVTPAITIPAVTRGQYSNQQADSDDGHAPSSRQRERA